jgi:hypothetical protein
LSQLETLTQINLDDLVASFGWQNQRILSQTLRQLFLSPARNFAKQMVEFDSAVGERGLANASRFSQRHYVKDVRLFSDPLPAGPFLALSNHPGMTDTLSLFCALDRPDLKIIALPAGHIEPDPDVYKGAVESLQTWTDSAGVFIRMAPETAVLPVLVRGVVWRKAARHPLLYIKRKKAERETLAAALQLLAHVMWNARPVTVRVQIGKPIYAKNVGTTDPSVIHEAVLAGMKQLIENPPQGEGRSVM